MTPFYQDELTTLFLGDNRDVVPTLDTKAIDLLLTDPPYGVAWPTNYTQLNDLAGFERPSLKRKAWKGIHGDAEPFDPSPWLSFSQVILWGANCYSDRLPKGRWLIWDKRYKSGKSFKLSDGEVAWMRGGHGIRIYAQTWQGISRSTTHPAERLNGRTPSFSPTQKPVALGVWCIRQARHVQTLLDPFAGSGSFLIAAKSIGIRSVGVEIEECYAETAARRLEKTRQEPEQLAFEGQA